MPARPCDQFGICPTGRSRKRDETIRQFVPVGSGSPSARRMSTARSASARAPGTSRRSAQTAARRTEAVPSVASLMREPGRCFSGESGYAGGQPSVSAWPGAGGPPRRRPERPERSAPRRCSTGRRRTRRRRPRGSGPAAVRRRPRRGRSPPRSRAARAGSRPGRGPARRSPRADRRGRRPRWVRSCRCPRPRAQGSVGRPRPRPGRAPSATRPRRARGTGPPGSRGQDGRWPRERSHSARCRAAVVLPLPSGPSSVMNRPTRRRSVAQRHARPSSGSSSTRRFGSAPRDRLMRLLRSAIWCWSRRM